MSAAAHTHDQAHDHGHDHHEPGFITKYIWSSDHKVIGVQYAISGLIFLLFGFMLMMLMRWSIAYPGQPIPGLGFVTKLPLVGWIFEQMIGRWAPGGVINGELYNMLGAMHGTIMVFLGIVPLGFAGFVNFVMPLQIGTIDMAFPRLNMWSFWLFLVSGIGMFAVFFLGTGSVQTGWTMYSPLASTTAIAVTNVWMHGHTWWLMSMVFNISASLLGAVNVITTVINLRAKGLTWMRLPFFCWVFSSERSFRGALV